jgi:hypothetical protein
LAVAHIACGAAFVLYCVTALGKCRKWFARYVGLQMRCLLWGNRWMPLRQAHEGKDRHPHPVPIKVYNETVHVMKSGIQTLGSTATKSSARSSGLTSKPANLWRATKPKGFGV